MRTKKDDKKEEMISNVDEELTEEETLEFRKTIEL